MQFDPCGVGYPSHFIFRLIHLIGSEFYSHHHSLFLIPLEFVRSTPHGNDSGAVEQVPPGQRLAACSDTDSCVLMCGRARCTLHREEIAALAGVAPDAFVDGDKYRPCENMGPGRYGPVTFCARDHGPSAGEKKDWRRHKKLQAMRWGLIPSFTKPHAKPDHFIMFNARSESLHERPAFRRLLEAKRCVVFSDGYYEWQQVDKREKQPYYISRTTGPLKFAGLYDTWENEEGEQMYTYTILTSEASPEMSWMHTRMPVILTDEGATRWLSEAKFDSLRELLVGYRGEDLKNHPVDRKVGSTKFQSEDCSKKVDIKHAADITSFFAASTPSAEGSKTSSRPPSQPDVVTSPRAAVPSTPQATTPVSTQGEPRATSQSHSRSATTSLDEMSTRSQPDVANGNSAVGSPVSTRSPFKSHRSEEFRSPIKFLFQQQHMVQQAEDILIASQAASASTAGTNSSSTASQHSPSKPTKPLHPSFIPASTLLSQMGTKRSSPPKHPAQSPKRAKKPTSSPKKPTGKNPQRGTLLAFFHPKS